MRGEREERRRARAEECNEHRAGCACEVSARSEDERERKSATNTEQAVHAVSARSEDERERKSATNTEQAVHAR